MFFANPRALLSCSLPSIPLFSPQSSASLASLPLPLSSPPPRSIPSFPRPQPCHFSSPPAASVASPLPFSLPGFGPSVPPGSCSPSHGFGTLPCQHSLLPQFCGRLSNSLTHLTISAGSRMACSGESLFSRILRSASCFHFFYFGSPFVTLA